MIPQAAVWVWFGIAWLFVLAVIFKRWRERQAADQAETDRQLARTKPFVGNDHYWDS